MDTIHYQLKIRDHLAFGTPVADITENLYFTKIDTYEEFEEFARTDLRDFVQQLGIEVVIVESPFDLVAQKVSTEHTTQFHTDATNLGTQFLQDFHRVLRDLDVAVLLTHQGTRLSSEGEIIADLYPKVRQFIHHTLRFQRTRRKYWLHWQRGAKGAIRFDHPPKRRAKNQTLADVTLPPPATPVPLQEGVDWTFPRAESPFEILTTGYGVPFGVLRLSTPTYDVEEILAQYLGSRAFDLILWPVPPDVPPDERPYSIYNSQVDLTLLADQYGGWRVQRGMRFAPRLRSGAPNAYFRPFEEFLQVLRVQFLELRQLVDFLGQIKDDLRRHLQPAIDPDLQRFDEECTETLHEKIRKILYPFPPREPWTVAQRWTGVIQELLTCFTWDQADDVATIILNGLLDLRDFQDSDAIDAAIAEGLGKGTWYRDS